MVLQKYFASLGTERHEMILVRDDAASPQWISQRKQHYCVEDVTCTKEKRSPPAVQPNSPTYPVVPSQSQNKPDSHSTSLMNGFFRDNNGGDHDHPVGKNGKTPTLTQNKEKHPPEAANHAEKRLIPEETNRRTYFDVHRGCEGPKANVAYMNGTVGRDDENVCRGSTNITDGAVRTDKIGDGVVSAKVSKKSNDEKGTEDTVTFLE